MSVQTWLVVAVVVTAFVWLVWRAFQPCEDAKALVDEADDDDFGGGVA